MTLGDVNPPVADGTFDPVKDEMRLKDGRVLNHYYRDTLKIKYFQPIDKTRFQLPPSGWCSWYFYYQEINQDEVKTERSTFRLTMVGREQDTAWERTATGLRLTSGFQAAWILWPLISNRSD